MEQRERYERTEAGSRPGLDENGDFRGIARHPLARRWLRRTVREAEKRGQTTLARKARAYAEKLGLEVR